MDRIKKKRRRKRRFVFYCARKGCLYHQTRLITKESTLEEAVRAFGQHAYLKIRNFPLPCTDPQGHQWQEAGRNLACPKLEEENQ